MQRLHDTGQDTTVDQATSTGTADVKTIAAPTAAVGCLISVETTNARMTFNGQTPTVGGVGHIVLATQQPLYLAFAETITFISTAAAASAVTVTWLF